MNHNDPSREIKIINSIFQFFGDLALCTGGNTFALCVCHHLIAMKDRAISVEWINPYISIWHSQHPEEESLSNDELQWALLSIDSHFSALVKEQEKKRITGRHPDARLTIIHGGLSERPAIPYENLNPDLYTHNYPDY